MGSQGTISGGRIQFVRRYIMKVLYKYTVIWFLIGIVSSVFVSKNATSVVVLLSNVLIVTIMANLAIWSITQERFCAGFVWTIATFGSGGFLGLILTIMGFQQNPLRTGGVILWFGIFMSVWIFADAKMYATGKNSDLLRRTVYTIFLFLAVVVIWSQRYDLLNKIQVLFS